ncbi:Dolichyl-diphosphooligosaccharide--protein glycosyltransferase subunit WBP1 [Choanephora cucurbitarum]|nr:Dolichyl-diphosphooligosaccharide--protein glycosyltransferase subunit WBP1 [Choanephora cucurbitarum]
MRIIYSLTAIVLSGLSVCVQAKSTTGDRVLVLLDSLAEKETYSQFWQQLEDRDFQLVFKAADDQKTTLAYFGETLYQHIIHFAPSTSSLEKHPSLSNIQLVNFVNQGGNLLAAFHQPSDTLRALAAEFDMDLETEVMDQSAKLVGPKTIVDPEQIKAPIKFTGAGLQVGKLPLSHAVLASNHQALVGTLQSRNSARVAFAGSLSMFSNDYMNAANTGNEAFVRQLSQWTFQEKSVLKVTQHGHHHLNETEQPAWYRVKDEMVYYADIMEYKDDQWIPYEANDVQLEIIMLDPYIRTTLKNHHGRFEAQLRLPDVYGVFTLKINYKRAGLSYLTAEDQVSIRPFRHNEYPRFLTAAYPYYASTLSMIVGFILFSAIWLSTWNQEKKKEQ